MAKIVSEGVRLPDDLDNFPDQNFPESLLRPFLGKWRLHHQAVDQHEAFVKDAAAAGVPIVPIPGAASAYRPFAQQEQLFFSRYVKGGGASTKTYKGVVYHLKPGMAMAATPGTSGHGWGLAVDYMNANGSAINLVQRAKLRQIGAKYAIVDSVKSENWHFTCQNAQMVVGFQPEPVDAPPAHEPEPVFGEGGSRVIGGGATGPLVIWIQSVLVARASQNLDGDPLGTYSYKTVAAVQNLQAVSKLPVTGVVDEATYNVLRWISVAGGGPDAPDA